MKKKNRENEGEKEKMKERKRKKKVKPSPGFNPGISHLIHLYLNQLWFIWAYLN